MGELMANRMVLLLVGSRKVGILIESHVETVTFITRKRYSTFNLSVCPATDHVVEAA